MKVLIFEQFSGGHYTNYCRHLIEKFSNENEVESIIIATTEKHLEEKDLKNYLTIYNEKVSVVKLANNVGASGTMKDRFNIFKNLSKVIKENKVDVVISTTADFVSTYSAIFSLIGYNPLKNVKSIGIFHYGYGKDKSDKKDFIKKIVYQLTYFMSKWKYKMFVNPIVYENIIKQKNMYLISDPVKVNKVYNKNEAREKLGLEINDRLIGYIGNIDRRKAVLEFLEAFFSIRDLDKKDKVLLMGKLDSEYKEFIIKKYKDEIENNRIIIIDRHLSFDEIEIGLGACDVVSVLYYDAPGLSANMLYAVCSGKRVIANSFGYTGMMINKFKIGSECTPSNIETIREAIVKEINCEYGVGEKNKIKKITEYYDVVNFQNCIGNLILESKKEVKKWEDIK